MDLTAVEPGLSIARVQYLGWMRPWTSEARVTPRSDVSPRLTIFNGCGLVCPRVTTTNHRSPCHRARDGHDDLFCSKIKASRVLGPAARSEGHYAQIRIQDSISCVARPHCRTSDHGHTLIKDSYQHLRADLRGARPPRRWAPV